MNSSGNEVMLKEYHSINKKSYKAKAFTDNGTLNMKQGNWPLNTWYTSYTELYLPAELAGIPISSQWGDFDASSYTGKIDLNTRSGTIYAENSGFYGELSTLNGNINISNNPGELKLTTTTGNINIKNAAITSVTNTNGYINMDLPSMTADLRLKNVTGI